MTEVSKGQIQTAALDHLGLVAAICQDSKIAQRIDDRLPCDHQRMEGINMIYFYDESLTHTVREVVTNLNKLRRKIIALFGKTAAWMYGTIHENWIEDLRT